MTDGRANWERRLEALDEQLASFGIDTSSEPAEAATSATLEERDTIVDDPDRNPRPEPDPIAGDVDTDEVDTVPAPAGDPVADDDDDDDHDAAAGRDEDRDAAGHEAEEGDEEGEEEEVAPRSRHRALLDWLVVIGVALLVAFLVRTFVLAHFVVDGVSMSTTLHDDDRVFVNKLSYRLHDPNRGDVVVLRQISGATSRDLIKRIVALPGEVVEVRNCVVTIDGQILEEPYLDAEATLPGQCGGDQSPLEVPEDHVFVMGDNRGQSQDSRALGPIDEDNLVGRAFVVFWPSSSWQWL